MRIDTGQSAIAGEKLEVLSRLPTVNGKFELMADYMQSLGFSDMFYGRLGVGSGPSVVLRRWDAEWEKLYTARRYEVWDEALRRGRESTEPFSLRVQRPIECDHQREFYAEAEAHNRLNGIAVPFHSVTRGVGGISVTGHDHAPTEGVMLTIAALGYVFDLSVGAALAVEVQQKYNITPRQMTFLRLLSEGSTHVETAEILGISEDWAHKTYARLREKFEVRTDAALVRRAMEYGILT